MKKKLLIVGAIFTFSLVVAATTGLNIQKTVNLKLNQSEALAECEDTIKKDGGIIIVTVCNRKTNFGGAITDVKCNAPATTSCSFSNVGVN